MLQPPGSRIVVVEFESAAPSVVKSIRQRDLLNTWLRLYASEKTLPTISAYQPSRLEEELSDLVFYTADARQTPPLLTIESEGTRISSAYGQTGKGRSLADYVGPRLAPYVMPVYYKCLDRALPVYTISEIDDIEGRVVAYERLLLPFSAGGGVSHVLASLKTISVDGGFEIRNLMRGKDSLPRPRLQAVIDRELVYHPPGRAGRGDIIEFS